MAILATINANFLTKLTKTCHPFGLRVRSHAKRGIWLISALFVIATCVACGNTTPYISYQPEFLPITIKISPDGISFAGDRSIVTEIGTFSIGADYSLQPPAANSIYVILRDRQTGFDHIYDVKTGSEQFTAVVNGKTTIAVTTSRVLIDVSKGTIEQIRFKRVSEPAVGGGVSIGNKLGARWDEGWHQSWYKPFALCRWAYDDSTIGKWYGVGFVWFLLRLVLAIFLFFVDAVLTIGFLFGQLGFMFFGPTGRDVIYGLLVLGTVVIGISAAASSF
jgi:hypothetical protein